MLVLNPKKNMARPIQTENCQCIIQAKRPTTDNGGMKRQEKEKTIQPKTYNVIPHVNPEIQIFDGRGNVVGVKVAVAEIGTRKDGVLHLLHSIIGQSGSCFRLTNFGNDGSLGKRIDKAGATGQARHIDLGHPIAGAGHVNVCASDLGIFSGVEQIVGGDCRIHTDFGNAKLQGDCVIGAFGSVSSPENHGGWEWISRSHTMVKARDVVERAGEKRLGSSLL